MSRFAFANPNVGLDWYRHCKPMSGRSTFSISGGLLAFAAREDTGTGIFRILRRIDHAQRSCLDGFTKGRQTRGERRCALRLLVIVSSLFLIGCGSSINRAVEQTVEQTYEIDPTGTLGFRNSAGSVRIYGSDDAHMKLKAVKKAWNTEQLNAIAVRVSVQTKSVSIETSFPAQKTWLFSDRSGTVDYVVIVPRTIKVSRLDLGNGEVLIEGMHNDVRANLVNGALTARNCFGNLQLSVANGGLDLLYEKWEQRPFLADARIISGNARAFLPRAASFHLLAETANGNVSNHFAEGEERSAGGATRIAMSVGSEPHPDINIRATNGNIEIAAAKSD
jgi:hypothetical protein